MGSRNPKTTPATTGTTPVHQLLGPLECGNNTTRNTSCSDRQKTLARHSSRREERVTVQGLVKKQYLDEMSHGGGLWHKALY